MSDPYVVVKYPGYEFETDRVSQRAFTRSRQDVRAARHARTGAQRDHPGGAGLGAVIKAGHDRHLRHQKGGRVDDFAGGV